MLKITLPIRIKSTFVVRSEQLTKTAGSGRISDESAFADSDRRIQSEQLSTDVGHSVRNAVQYQIVGGIARLSSHTTAA